MKCAKRYGPPGPTGWLGIGARLLATLFLLLLIVALNHCTAPTPTSSVTAATLPPNAMLSIEVDPEGASIQVDGLRKGTTPISLQLPAGQHTIRIEMDGYEPMEERRTLAGGDNVIIVGDLNPLPRTPVPTLPPTWTPTPVERLQATPTPSPTITSSPPTATPPPPTATPLPPTATPPPPTATPVPVPTSAVSIREGQVTISTYPYADFVSQAWSDLFSMSYSVLDWRAYESSSPTPVDVTYRTLVMENEYLALTFLPDLGGRLYQVFYKPTGHLETYRNPVLKPSPWGPPEQGWWLAAGGFEWCLPVDEHGYEWDQPWKLTASQDLQSASVTLRDTATDAEDRVRAVIVVRLDGGASSFSIQHRLENPTGAPINVKYWTNAMLAPGGQNAPSADLRFVLPDAVTEVTIHSRGDEFLPGYNERMAWPVFDGIDLSRLGNWNRWLGFFEDPASGGFMAVYDEGYDEGMVRVYPADVAPGSKGFAFGWREPIPSRNWTDDNSGYVEIHGGPAPTFDDSVTLPAGGHLQWRETWYPVAGLGGLRYANEIAALNLSAGDGQAHIAVAVIRPWSGDAVLLLDGQERWRQSTSLVPGQPFRALVPLGDDLPQTGQLALRLETPDGAEVAKYSAKFNLK